MVPGFNTDFKYRGETYHIQTEDNGVANPVVVTLLYHKGAILASRRTSYRELAARPGFEPDLMALMKNQHKELMRSLLAGEFDKDGTAPAVVGGTGEDPADAAAAVSAPAAPTAAATAAAAPLRQQAPALDRRIPRVAPAAVAPPAMAPPRPAPPATTAAVAPPAVAPRGLARPAAMTLDEAIRHYLEQFAATAAAGAR